MPRLSLITVNFNNAAGLRKTIESVTNQIYQDYEYIIIDGGSTDDSIGIIEEYKDKIKYWVSESDEGIYHAMNKGIAKASGEYLLFLNSGDFLVNELVFQDIHRYWGNADLIYGNLLVDNSKKVSNLSFPAKLTFKYFLTNSLPHPCTFIKRSLFDSVGLYNERLTISSDWEFFIKAVCTFNCTYEYINKPVSVIDTVGISRDPENMKVIANEVKGVLMKNFPAFIEDSKALSKLYTNFLSRIANKIKSIT